MRYPYMLYSTNDITFIYNDKIDNIISDDDFANIMLFNSGINVSAKLPFKSIIFNIIISDSQCRTLFGHDFMRSPNYHIYTLSVLLEQCTLSTERENSIDIDVNKHRLNRLKTAYKLLDSMYKFTAYKIKCIEELYINDEDGHICGELAKPQYKQYQEQVERISITPLNRLASTDPLYATLQTDCAVSLPYDKWVLRYHLTSLPSNQHVGQIWLYNDTILTNAHKYWLSSAIDYKNMIAINRQVKRHDNCTVIVEIQPDSNPAAPKEMLQYIFNEHVQLNPPSSTTMTRTDNDIKILVLILSIIILIVNSIVMTRR